MATNVATLEVENVYPPSRGKPIPGETRVIHFIERPQPLKKGEILPRHPRAVISVGDCALLQRSPVIESSGMLA